MLNGLNEYTYKVSRMNCSNPYVSWKWAGSQKAKLGNKKLEGSRSIGRDGCSSDILRDGTFSWGSCSNSGLGVAARVSVSHWQPRKHSFSLVISQFLCSMATAIVICDDSSIESPQTKFACIACLLILCECSNCSTYDVEGQNLTQTSLKFVIVMKHGNFREP